MRIELQPGEQVLREGRANHYVNHFLMAGFLVLTNRRLTFVAHPLNFRQYSLSIPLTEIAGVELRYNLKIFSHGIWVHQNGSHQHFAVWRRKHWKAAIEAAVAAART
jgi:DUF1365 family protein